MITPSLSKFFRYSLASLAFINCSVSAESFDICDTTHIYNDSFTYSLPLAEIKKFISGEAFNNTPYTKAEIARVKDDISSIYHTILKQNPVKQKLAIISAGAPGAGKTFLLNQLLLDEKFHGKNYAYICPDDVCLKQQTTTYLADKGDGSKEALEKAYNKWRPASNAATHLILGNLIRQNYAFYYGTTSSSPYTYRFFEFLKEKGYRIKLIHVSATDKVRWDSIMDRDKTFVQTTERDVAEKGILIIPRLRDTFLKYADEIDFYFREKVASDAQLAARWVRNEAGSHKLGMLFIIDPEQYDNLKHIHNLTVSTHDFWETEVEAFSTLVR